MILGQMTQEEAVKFAATVRENILHLQKAGKEDPFFGPPLGPFEIHDTGAGQLVLTGRSNSIVRVLMEAISVEWGGPFKVPMGMVSAEALADDTHPLWDDLEGLDRIVVDFAFQKPMEPLAYLQERLQYWKLECDENALGTPEYAIAVAVYSELSNNVRALGGTVE